MISLIVAVDDNNAIGKDNHLLCHLPKDLQQFKKLTLGKPVIMGRKTYESIGKPLPQRRNLVVSTQLTKRSGVEIYPSLPEALKACGSDDEVMIIGGATLYQAMLPYADRLYVSHIHHQFDADTFFPKIEEKGWQEISSETFLKDEKNPFTFDLKIYQKTNDK